MKVHIGLLALAVLAACSSDENAGAKADGKIITSNDFESVAGWNADPSALDRGRAHSGEYAIKVDGSREFSLSYDMALGAVSKSKFKKVLLEGWAYLPSEKATGVLGLQVMEPTTNQQVFGDDIKLGDEVKKYKEWVHVQKVITLPDNINPAQHLRLSLWRASASDVVLIDDIKLSIQD